MGVGAGGLTVAGRAVATTRWVGDAVGEAAIVAVTFGVGDCSGVGLDTLRGVKVGRGVRVGVAVGLFKAIRLVVSQARTTSIAAKISPRNIFRSKCQTPLRTSHAIILW
jgi:hypothetical protein